MPAIFTRDNPHGRNIHFGIREHGMCAIMNGVGYHGIFRASGATFLVFADYCRAIDPVSRRSRNCQTFIFLRTTRSPWAKMAPLMSRSRRLVVCV